MHDGIKLSYIGLTEQEIRVLKSIFTLAPQLSENYSLTSPSRLQEADVILVNADNPESIGEWKKISRVNNLTSSLMLSDLGDVEGEEVTLQRPIRVQKLIAALEDIVHEQTSFNIKEPGSAPDVTALIVDDSFPVRKYMEHKLNELIDVPIKLSFAGSGEEAIDKAMKKTYDIIFLDVMMDGVDGYKACKTIKAHNNAYIVMLTSKKSPFDKVRGTMSGCDAYVTKPPTDERLIEEVQKCLKRRAARSGDIAMTGTR